MSEEISLKNSALMEADRVLAIASHDIKNPLQAIQLEAQMLLKIAKRHEKTLISQEVQIQAQRILNTTNKLANILTDLIDRRRRQYKSIELSEEKRELNLMQIIWDVIDTLRPIGREKNQKFLINSNFDKIPFYASYTKIFQLFTNLIGNSLKFSPAQSEIRVQVSVHDDHWFFNISDEGPGISDELMDKLFEEFSRGKSHKSGFGLGLFTCRNIVSEYGGTIKAYNLSQGACFEVTFPVMIAGSPCS